MLNNKNQRVEEWREQNQWVDNWWKELHDLARTELPRRPGRKGLQKGQGDILSQAILSCRIPSTKRGVNSLRCSPGRWECKYLDRRIFTPLYRSLLTQGQDGRVPACLGVPSSRIRVTQAASVRACRVTWEASPITDYLRGFFPAGAGSSDLPDKIDNLGPRP